MGGGLRMHAELLCIQLLRRVSRPTCPVFFSDTQRVKIQDTPCQVQSSAACVYTRLVPRALSKEDGTARFSKVRHEYVTLSCFLSCCSGAARVATSFRPALVHRVGTGKYAIDES